MNAIRELLQILADAWQETDLGRRLRAWWWCMCHPHELDKPGGWLQ